jgi:hypothetical protein
VAIFENSVIIRRPIKDVFAFPVRLREHPQVELAIVETHKVSEGAAGLGTTYQQVRSVPNRSEESFEVTAYNLHATWNTRPTRAIPIPLLLYPGRHCRGNPGHELRGAGTPRPWPSARASRRATCPGRRGRQPQKAQGTAGPIAVGHTGGTDQRHPRVSNGQSRQVNGLVDGC